MLEMQGPDQEADTERFNECLGMALEQGMITDAVVASSGAERNRLWAVREDFSAILQDQPQFLYDVSLPIRHMLAYVSEVQG
ncbi:FAD-linked oxidase C-terminal domain-containing protein, partial [Staphylococcus aureus]